VEEARREFEKSQPSAAKQVAQALFAVHSEFNVSLEILFGIQTPEVQTEGLLQMAEWRDPKTIRMFLQMGANVNAIDTQGYTVLDMVLMGHDGYWRGDSKHWNEEVFKILAEYKVKRNVLHHWIINDCVKGAPKYVLDFLGV
jgi:hypothetical protein